MLLASAGCHREATDAATGVRQTKFPGMVTAGGGSSGEVLARNAKPVTDGTYAGGTPGIAGGAGGTSGGAATAGHVQESGQGPSSGTTQPAAAGQAGASLPPGDMGKPAAPAPESNPRAPAVNRDPSHSAAPGR
jgi:hypothetical protein